MNLAAFLPTSLSALMFLWMASITTSSSSSYSCFATAFFLPTSQIIPTATNGVHSVTKNKLLSLLFLQHHHRAEKIVTTPPSSSNVHRRQFPSTTKLHAAEINNSNNNIDPSRIVTNDLGLDIVRGTGMENADEISDQTWEEIEESAPSKLMIVKNVSFCVCCIITISSSSCCCLELCILLFYSFDSNLGCYLFIFFF